MKILVFLNLDEGTRFPCLQTAPGFWSSGEYMSTTWRLYTCDIAEKHRSPNSWTFELTCHPYGCLCLKFPLLIFFICKFQIILVNIVGRMFIGIYSYHHRTILTTIINSRAMCCIMIFHSSTDHILTPLCCGTSMGVKISFPIHPAIMIEVSLNCSWSCWCNELQTLSAA